VLSESGDVSVASRKTPVGFCDKIKTAILQYADLTKDVILLSKEINEKSE
jgi:hypothetical protein